MYKIPLNSKLPLEFYKSVETNLRTAIEDFVIRKSSFVYTFKDKAKTTVTIKVLPCSYTESFLNMILAGDTLMHLVTGDLYYMLDLIKIVKSNDVDGRFFRKITIADYRNYGNDALVIDSFYEIMHKIFVENLFEKQGVIDKTIFNRDINLRVCPYCSISQTEYEPDKNVKAQLDHFFPKGIYPFLAMSYYNLIPVCHVCNMVVKLEKDPIDRDTMKLKIQYPYKFDNSLVHFSYIPDANMFRTGGYLVNTGYANENLKNGYEDILDITERYKNQGVVVKNIHAQLSSAVGFGLLRKMKNIGYVYKHFKATALGSPDLKPWEEPLYKLKHDCFDQLIKEI